MPKSKHPFLWPLLKSRFFSMTDGAFTASHSCGRGLPGCPMSLKTSFFVVSCCCHTTPHPEDRASACSSVGQSQPGVTPLLPGGKNTCMVFYPLIGLWMHASVTPSPCMFVLRCPPSAASCWPQCSVSFITRPSSPRWTLTIEGLNTVKLKTQNNLLEMSHYNAVLGLMSEQSKASVSLRVSPM